ncbi:MAG TPA: YfhO family protein [Thermoanaerobaculia bacterium]|nr:YfhO family protein [Thermoanaerobaculia bacterium]
MALALYVATTLAILVAWDRCIARVPRAIALVLVLMPLLFLGRALLTNKTAAPADMPFMAEPLRSYASDFGVRVPDGGLSDLHCQIIPWQRAVRHSLANGQWPLWNPFILSGDILAAAAQPAVYDPFHWIGMLIPLVDAFTFSTALTFFFAGFFAWAFARANGISDIAALVVAAGFMFCGMLAFFAGWPLGRAWSYLPLVLFAARRIVYEEKFGLLALAFVLVIAAGHPESVLHIVAVGAVYGAFEWTRVRKVRPLLLALAAGITALLLTAVYLLPFFEAVPQSLESFIREEMYATQSYDVLAKPDVRMDRIRRTFVPYFRGTEPLTARVGPIVLALAMIGLIVRWRHGETWFFALLAAVCFFATWGMWPVAHALHELPLFEIAINERLAFAAALAVAMLAGFGVDATGGLRRPLVVPLAILALVLAQRVHEDGSFYAAHPRETFFPRIPLIAAVPRDARTIGLGFTFTGNNPTMYGLEDARGYQAMTNRRYYETYVLWSHYQTAWYNRVDDLSLPFLSFLNVGYAIGQGDPPEGWRVLKEERGTRLYENLRHLPRAFVPRRIRYEREGKATLAGMQHATDFGHLAWIEAPEYEPHEIDNGTGHVTLRRTGLAYELDASMERDGWVVVSATAWKGWRARVDGKRIESRFANHAFLGIFVPRGTHRVTLDYMPRSFTRGRNISLLTLAVIAIAFFGRIARACRPSSSTFPSRSR